MAAFCTERAKLLANAFINSQFRSSRLDVFCRKGFHRNFAKFTGKHLCWSPFLNKVAVLKACNFVKKDSGTGVFLWILRNFLEHLFLQNTSGGCFCQFYYASMIWMFCRQDFDIKSSKDTQWRLYMKHMRNQIKVYSLWMLSLFIKSFRIF